MTAQNHVVGPDGHVDVDVLSDLVEGLLAEAEAAEAEAHVADCADCRDTRDALVEVRELLAGQPPEPMPDDVFARIESALAVAASADDARGTESAEVPAPRPEATPHLGSLPPPRPRRDPDTSAPVVELHAVRPRRLAPILLGLAAAVAAVVLGVGVIGGGLTGGGSEDSNNADAPASAPSAAATLGAGEKSAAGAVPPAVPSSPSLAPMSDLPVYTAGTLDARVGDLVKRQSVASSFTTGGGLPTAADSSQENGSGKSSTPAVPSCVRSAAAGKAAGRTQAAAERAVYEGQVAYVLVYPEPNGRSAEVLIVSAACAEPDRRGANASASPQTSRVLLTTTVPLD